MRLGFLGLGKMGKQMVTKLLEDGHEVVVWNRSYEAVEKFQNVIARNEVTKQSHINKEIATPRLGEARNDKETKMTIVKTIPDLVQQLSSPRIFWLMLPAGEATETVFQEVARLAQKGDIIIDGGNSFYKDTERRNKQLEQANISFLGIGTSGGILAANNGFPLMVGGDRSAYEYVKPLLDSLSKPTSSNDYFGKGGAGHFVKMVHNAIEYGMMQSLGEGFGILQKGPYQLNLEKVASLWTKKTIISGFLMDRVVEILSKYSTLSNIVGSIEESGEAKWTVTLAKKLNVPITVIEDSLKFRHESQKDKNIQQTFAAKLVASLRNAFGGHKVEENS